MMAMKIAMDLLARNTYEFIARPEKAEREAKARSKARDAEKRTVGPAP